MPRDGQRELRPGIKLLNEVVGDGPLIERHLFYEFRLRIWLHRGDAVKWSRPWGLVDDARLGLSDDGTTLFTALRVDREFMFGGLFYGVQGMRLGGSRRLQVAPHLAFGESGVPGVIPANALLTLEVCAVDSHFPSFSPGS